MSETRVAISRFCERHNACEEMREWAMRECKDMHEVWATAKPEWLLWVATRPGVLSDHELRLFACWCARRVWHLLDDERSRLAVEVAERYAKGEASDDALAAAQAAARAAARDTGLAEARAAARDSAHAAAQNAGLSAAWAAAHAAAQNAARDSAHAAAWAAAHAAAWAAAWDAQADYLRGLTPNFEPPRSGSGQTDGS